MYMQYIYCFMEQNYQVIYQIIFRKYKLLNLFKISLL